MASSNGSIGSGDLHDGLTNRSPSAPDDKPKGKSVDDGATRDKAAATPKPIGPRTA